MTRLVRVQQAFLIGPIRQEVLSGLRDAKQFNTLRATLRAFDDLRIEMVDYESAADLSNKCGRRGVQGTQTDFVICAISLRYDVPIFTTDTDYLRYAKHIDIRLHHVQEGV
jgi:predicted nucleic acid-binding protein